MATARTKEADPATQLRGLEAALRQGDLPRVALLRGEEQYFVERGLALLIAAAEQDGEELCRHDARDPEFRLSSLLDDLGGSSLFSAARCVVVRGADDIVKKVAEAGAGAKSSATIQSPFTTTALAFLASSSAGHLFVTARKLRADHAFSKAIKKASGLQFSARKLYDSPPPWDPDPRKSELAQWVRARAGELEVRLAADDAAFLAAATGNDLPAIDMALEKVRLAGSQGLAAVVGWQSGGSPWKVADDLLGGDLGRGVGGVESLFRGGFRSDRDGKTLMDRGGLVAMLLVALRGKARKALVASRAMARGKSLDEAADEAGVSRQKMARTALQSDLRLRTWNLWQAALADISELEFQSRSRGVVDAADFARLALRWQTDPTAAVTPRGRR
jgi:DNA polymerase III delta subunit